MFKLNGVDKTAIKTIFNGTSASRIAFVLVLIALNTAATLGTPVIFGYLIDGLTAKTLAFPALMFCLYAVLAGAARFIGDLNLRFVEFIELDVIHHAGNKLFNAVLRKKASIAQDLKPGFMVDAVRNMQDSYGIYVFLTFSTLFPSVLETVAAASLVATLINWQIGLLVLAYAVIIIALTYWSNEQAKDKHEDVINSIADSSDHLGEAISSFQIIKTSSGSEWFSGIYRMLRAKAHQSGHDYHRIRLKFAWLRSLAFALQLGLMYFISLRLYQSGDISIGQIVIFNGLILQLNRPSELIAGALEDLLTARQLQSGYRTIINYPEFFIDAEHTGNDRADEAAERSNRVEFQNVSFGYSDNHMILTDFNAKFEKGHMNFIVGPSGVGKSTMIKLILRFVENYEGKILLFGRPLGSFTEPELFSSVGYVPQSPDILAATLADNLKLGSNLGDEAVLDALTKVGLEQLVSRLPDGIETYVGRGGMPLSGGEMQRVAIARAIIRRPRVLILDEPSSALDAETERSIFEHLRLLDSEMCIIAITHRTGVIEKRDYLLDFTQHCNSSAVLAHAGDDR